MFIENKGIIRSSILTVNHKEIVVKKKKASSLISYATSSCPCHAKINNKLIYMYIESLNIMDKTSVIEEIVDEYLQENYF